MTETAPRPVLPRTLVLGSVLVVLGAVFWALYALESGREVHSFTGKVDPPQYVQLVAGHTYWIGIPGGVARAAELGVTPGALQCTARRSDGSAVALSVTAERAETKATNQIASFLAAFTAPVHIECDRIGAVYVDNAADADYDWSGVWLVLASITLAVGAPLTLAGLRARPRLAASGG